MDPVLEQCWLVQAVAGGALAMGGLALGGLVQCGKSSAHNKPAHKKRKPGQSSKSGGARKPHASGKSGASQKSGRSSRSGKSDRSKRKKSDKSRGVKSSKSSNSEESSRRRRQSSSSKSSASAAKKSSNNRKSGPKATPKAAEQSSKTPKLAKNAKKTPQPPKTPKSDSQNVASDMPKELYAEPRELRFQPQGGLLKVNLVNPTGNRLAIKLKCSDNNLYRVNPVHAFVPPKANLSVDVVRQNGVSKVDKLVFVVNKVSDKMTNPKDAFEPKQTLPLIVIPLLG